MQITTEAFRFELEPLKVRMLETQYMQRDIEDLQTQLDSLTGNVQKEVLGLKN